MQLELAQCNYMEEQEPFAYNPTLAEPTAHLLKALLSEALEWGRSTYAGA
ncbi:N-formylglutamate deformylase [Marinobacterium lacunae]|uniref:N-formylglutamate deformylase n=1 Tax=Marinobacterium lacunae TaxID=1232683 RepID=A0A081G1T8_9GAMM|nr:N-formylglutamate deformylase [Marinobacterium lacunae]